MLNGQKHIILFFVLQFFSFLGISQHSASASFTASVNIIEPISLKNTSNMNFASVDARNGGTVTLNPDHTRTTTGDVYLDSDANVSAAIFEVRGQNGYSYNIHVPSGSFSMTNGSSEITLKDININSDDSSITNDVQTLSLGATLEIEPGQKPGIYTTPAPIEITVSYN